MMQIEKTHTHTKKESVDNSSLVTKIKEFCKNKQKLKPLGVTVKDPISPFPIFKIL